MKPWETKEWQKMRAQRIGDRCEQCGSTDGPFVLQHFSHERPEPPSKKSVVWGLMREYDRVPPRPTVQRPACPRCNRRALSERKKLRPKWRCIGCHHEFDEPIIVETTINNRTEKDAWLKWRQEVLFKAFNDFVDAQAGLVEQRYGAAMADYEQEIQTGGERMREGVWLRESSLAVEDGPVNTESRKTKGLLQAAMKQMQLSARDFHRILKVSRTIADLAGAETIGAAHLAEALQYRPTRWG